MGPLLSLTRSHRDGPALGYPLRVPLAYLVWADVRMAELILRFSRLPAQRQDLMVKTLRVMQDGDSDDQKSEATTAPAKVTRRSKPR